MQHWWEHFSVWGAVEHLSYTLVMTGAIRVLAWVWGKRFSRKKEVAFWGAGIISCALLLFTLSGTERINAVTETPDFKPNLSFVNVGQGYSTERSPTNSESFAGIHPIVVFLGLEIVNRGGPSIIRDWRLDIEAVGGTRLTAKLLPRPTEDIRFQSEHGRPAFILPKAGMASSQV